MRSEVCECVVAQWDVYPLEKVCHRITSGGTPSRKEPGFYINGKWPWVKSTELLDCYIDDTEEHITDSAVQYSSAKILPKNTVLVALYGATVGKLGILRREAACNQACCALLVNPRKADFRYIFYQLLLHRKQLKNLAVGAAQQNISGELIKSFELPFPPLPEQRAIAAVLGALDDKIELNRQMNQTLEAIAQAIFKSWFVDFDPVRAKAEGREPAGLAPEIAALFPNRFVESELGPIPEGWRTSTIGAELMTLLGGTPSRTEPKYWENGTIPWIN
ncbi:MAG: restriction endonuclease subunit S, partial [Candidatus Methanomethyliaceae archaeon]